MVLYYLFVFQNILQSITNFDSQQNNDNNNHEETQNEFVKLFVHFLGVEVRMRY